MWRTRRASGLPGPSGSFRVLLCFAFFFLLPALSASVVRITGPVSKEGPISDAFALGGVLLSQWAPLRDSGLSLPVPTLPCMECDHLNWKTRPGLASASTAGCHPPGCHFPLYPKTSQGLFPFVIEVQERAEKTSTQDGSSRWVQGPSLSCPFSSRPLQGGRPSEGASSTSMRHTHPNSEPLRWVHVPCNMTLRRPSQPLSTHCRPP